MMLDHHDRNVVELDTVWHRKQWAVRRPDRRRQVIDHPVGAVADPGFRQKVRRLQGLGETWSKPADRIMPAGFAQRVDRRSDHGALVIHQMCRHLVEAVHHELPSRVASRLCHPRISGGHGAVDRQGWGDPKRVQGGFQTPKANSHSVLMPGPVWKVGGYRSTLRRGQDLTRHGAVDVPALDIHDHENRDPFVVGKRQSRPVDAGLICEAMFWFHGHTVPVDGLVLKSNTLQAAATRAIQRHGTAQPRPFFRSRGCAVRLW